MTDQHEEQRSKRCVPERCREADLVHVITIMIITTRLGEPREFRGGSNATTSPSFLCVFPSELRAFALKPSRRNPGDACAGPFFRRHHPTGDRTGRNLEGLARVGTVAHSFLTLERTLR